MDYGSVSAMGSFYMGNEGSPRFENFSVWTP